jgi:hypothetical protein
VAGDPRRRARRAAGGDDLVDGQGGEVRGRTRGVDLLARHAHAVVVGLRGAVPVDAEALEVDGGAARPEPEEQRALHPFGLQDLGDGRECAPVGDGEHARREDDVVEGRRGEQPHHPLGGIDRVGTEGLEPGDQDPGAAHRSRPCDCARRIVRSFPRRRGEFATPPRAHRNGSLDGAERALYDPRS